MEDEEETMITIISALSTLPPPQLSLLTNSLLSLSLHHHRRLFSLLSSPSAFSFTLRHLHSLSLSDKSLLIANHLLFTLHHLTRHFLPPPPLPSVALKHRDLDAILLLLLLCDIHQHNPHLLKTTPHSEWREILHKLCSDTVLTQSSVGVHYGGVILPYIEVIARCRRFIGSGIGVEKERTEVVAAPAAVVALPAVEVEKGGGGDCVICREEMEEGRDVCELPCQHMFHWMCILPWFKKRNSCPCCRFQLPTEDVIGDIQRLWSVVVKMSGGTLNLDGR
ncbi:E3 ubiquitin-protein ligase SGR9, amyloplastic [Euphorbia lathyris]|uniref:E3 ubiquitin-protein ligase SGR9, amyloplastic n=1 Tax=Euphorbia lathyris TaxID=212925 RepID=UPI0033141D23